MNNQKSILVFLFLLIQMSTFSQTRVCFDVKGGSAIIPDFTFQYEAKTYQGQTINADPLEDGDCWLMTYPGLDPNQIKEVNITTSYDQDPLNGVTTYDMVVIARHIVGIDNEDCDIEEEILKIIASDVNNSGTVTTFDLVQLRQLILYIITDFPNNESWRFLNGNRLTELANDPDLEPNDIYSQNHDLSLKYLAQDLQTEISIAAYKIADVNGYCN